ncbi:uncharacterized protein LOC124325931 [Daphnia pulicaria]|uniref:uncharacterized protein LOC124325931 n=1 Tax=Daphnia pulicaria TaxID=35523 RepID=UPI001EEC3055|nr:uncharacterized protein LOC124325931 [Daphnia pulicaria]
MPFTTFIRRNIAQEPPQIKSPVSNRNFGLRWAAIGGIVLGFLGAMKITGNLNREFFAELIKMGPAGKAPPPLHQQQQTDADPSKKSPLLPPGTEATIIVK